MVFAGSCARRLLPSKIRIWVYISMAIRASRGTFEYRLSSCPQYSKRCARTRLKPSFCPIQISYTALYGVLYIAVLVSTYLRHNIACYRRMELGKPRNVWFSSLRMPASLKLPCWLVHKWYMQCHIHTITIYIIVYWNEHDYTAANEAWRADSSSLPYS